MPSAHDGQNVHSKLQMRASPSGASPVPHFSHSVRISSAIAQTAYDPAVLRWFPAP